MMPYFDDLHIETVGIYPHYTGSVLNRKPQNYSLELIASGRMHFQRDNEVPMVIDFPALRWQSPGHTYNYGAVDSDGWEHYFVLMQGPRAARLYHDGFEPLIQDSCVMPIRRVDRFRELFTRMHNHIIHPGLNSRRAVIFLEEMLFCAMEELKEPTQLGHHIADFERITAELHLNLGQKTDFREIARRMDISYSHFRKLFVDYAGAPPHHYLLQARLNAAAELLRKTDKPIKAIAYDLGLGNPAQFSKTFRAAFNLPPATYRSQTREIADAGSPQ